MTEEEMYREASGVDGEFRPVSHPMKHSKPRVKLYDPEGEDADYAADRWDNDRMRGPDGGW